MLALIALGRAQRAVHRSEAAESTHREALELIENSRIPFTLRPVLAGDLAADLARSDMNSTAEWAQEAQLTPGEPAFLLSALLPWDELVQCLLHTGHGAEAAEAISALENHTGDAERMRLGRVHSAAVRAVHEEILHTARELLQECLAGARDRRLSPMQLRVELRLAEVWAETGRSEAAGQMNTSAEETIRRLARSIEDPELRSSFLASDSAR